MTAPKRKRYDYVNAVMWSGDTTVTDLGLARYADRIAKELVL